MGLEILLSLVKYKACSLFIRFLNIVLLKFKVCNVVLSPNSWLVWFMAYNSIINA